MASPTTTTLDTLITLKVNHNGVAKRFKLPLRDLTMVSLEDKIRNFLQIPVETAATIERYSDSAATFVTVEKDNVPVYKQLFRAAKAKHKLKLRVTSQAETPVVPKPVTVEDEPETETTQATSLLNFSAPSNTTLDANSSVADAVSQATSVTVQDNGADTPTCPIGLCKRAFTVCCNKCDRAVPDAHFHCSTCDEGDFDLCEECVNEGVTCHDDSHWLIKRTIKDGEISYSTTQVAPKKTPAVAPSVTPAPVHSHSLPIRLLDCPATRVSLAPTWSTAYNARTCNSCVQEYPEQEFVHCTTCDDFDLCKGCFVKDQHGHHPKHAFTAAAKGTVFEPLVSARLAAGRDILHNAICDGCDQYVRGVRHKCLDCPDWDYCSECVENAAFIHPNHRFVPIYEPLSHPTLLTSAPATHFGICCDGPLCTSRRGLTRYVVGDRYKCAVCHDTDFCANCEASPANTHNKTHPLIKFKTPVRHVSVTTTGEHEDGQRMPPMGDRSARRHGGASRSGETTPSARESIAASPVQTVVDVQPTEQQPVEFVKAEPVETKQEVAVQTEKEPLVTADLIATYQHDTVADGTIMPPSHTFQQTWVLRNEGTAPWPAGCSVKFVGGDYMGAVDPAHPAGLHELVSASESTICYNALNPGQEFPFTVLMRTPDREGKVISYWRLMTNDGVKFGHKLWCDVQVQKPVYTIEPSAREAEIAHEIPEETTRSQMIIPKLEHESPSASILEDTRAEEDTVTETETSSHSVRGREEDDFEDCAEADDWANDSDDGFMTDEEYDILDASDEEYLSEQHKTAASRR